MCRAATLPTVAGQRALAAADVNCGGCRPADCRHLHTRYRHPQHRCTCTTQDRCAQCRRIRPQRRLQWFYLQPGSGNFHDPFRRLSKSPGDRLRTYHLVFELVQRDTAVLFGDGAGAVLVEPSVTESGLLYSHLGCEGEVADALQIPNFGTAGNRYVENYAAFGVQFDGREIFRRAVKGMAQETEIVLEKLGLTEAISTGSFRTRPTCAS